MEVNPYQSPTAEPAAALAATDLRVEGKHLIVRNGAVLPPYCVRTNEALQPDDVRQQQFTWCPPIVGLMIVLSGLIFIIVYFIVRKQCTIAFGMSHALRERIRKRRLLKIVAAIGLFFALPVTAGIDSTPLIAVVFVLFLVAIVSLFVGNSPLAITKYRQGEFWFSGCSPEFLARVAARAVR